MKDDEVALWFDESTNTFNIRHKKIEIDIKQKDFKDGCLKFIKEKYKGKSVTDDIFDVEVKSYVEKLIKDSK
ncbi:MAG TPA: hypothetical protein EYQ86_00260 [Bacteroidetes bacterium]|nr:hypothetical protein [Bacteroidota bacterium]